jgi:nucleotide-binding universal stress UspA family protein
MSLRNILVHLNDDERTAVRLKVATELARSQGARLTGVFARVTPPHQVGVVAGWPSQAYLDMTAASKASFAAATQGLAAEWIDLNRRDEADVLQQMTDLARHFDLVVLGQFRAGDEITPPDLNEELIVQTGRPALVVPYSGDFECVGLRPIFAWSDSAASARALADGLRLVREGAEALVVGLSRPGDDSAIAYQKQSLNLSVAHLAAHGVAAHAEQLSLSDIGLMDALLNRAADHGADVLGIGAFGGKANRLFSRGGSGSRYMLKHMTLPVLFSH